MNDSNFSWVLEGQLAGHRSPSSEQELLWLKDQGIRALIRMAEKDEAMVNSSQIESLGLNDCYEPVEDFDAPTEVQIDRMIDFIEKSLSTGKAVGVSCGAGKGRTGTILACYLVKQFMDSDAAIKNVRDKRPGSIEVSSQEEAIRKYSQRLGK